MKRYNYLIFFAAAAFAAACAKEAPLEEEALPSVETRDVMLGLTMPSSETRTVLGSKSGSNYPVYWQAGDRISLNGALSEAVPSEDSGKNKTTLLVRDASISAPYNVLYPGEAGVADKVTFPATQDYTSGTFAANSLPMYATAPDLSGGFEMQYLGSVLRIPVKFTSSTKLRQITLTAVGGEPLGGTFAVGKSDGAFNGELSSFSTVSTIYYKFGSSGTTFASNATGVFYIAIPKGTYSRGIEMRVYDTDGNYMKADLFSDSNSVEAGKVYEFTKRAYNPDGTVFYIESVSDLQTFAGKSGEKYCLLEAQLLKDINMSGKDYDSDKFAFYGTLDGGGHTISGLTKPLFNNLYGSVRNLTVNAKITTAVLSGANEYGLGILARYAYVASGEEEGDYGQVIEGVTTTGSISISYSPGVDFSVGGMLGANKGVPMSSCENRASVTINELTPSVSGTFRVGGLAGSAISSSASISGCANYGAVKVVSATMFDASSIFTVGGLIGYDTKDNLVENSYNSGPVTVDSVTGAEDAAPYFMLGGIVGNSTAESFKLSGCVNYSQGAVTLGSGCTVQAARVGGIIGRVGGDSSLISDNSNWGPVQIQAATLSGSPTIGGVIGAVLADNVEIVNCSNDGPISNAAVKADTFGGVVGYHNQNGSLLGCTNHANIVSTVVPANDICLGGVLGKKVSAKQISFTLCKNEGDITLTCGAFEKSVYMGGIIAACPGGSSTFSNCSNSGKLTNNAEKSTKDGHHNDDGSEIPIVDDITNNSFTPAVSLGGIIGRVTDNELGAVADCSNSGDIINNCAATDIRLGGIIGYSHQTLSDVLRCTNSGLISSNVLADYCYIHLGGILGYTKSKVTMSEQNVNTGKIQSNHTSRVNLLGLAETAYDDNIRLGGCIGSLYYHSAECVLTDQKNEGEIVHAGTVPCGWVYMGGLEGYAQRAVYKGALNKGYVHNEGTVGSTLLMGGILGRADCKNSKQAKVQSSSANEGNVVNNGTSATTNLGGICAEEATTTDLSYCSNSGTVKNTGSTAAARLGGICGYSGSYVSFDHSDNSGDVIFEGTATEAVFMGGISGYQKSNVNTVIRNNANSGAISCNVAVPKDLEIAGIVADAAGKISSCTNSGPVSVKGNVGASLYCGGICGWLETNANNPVSECLNEATGKITVAPGLTITKQIFCSGVIGGEKAEIAVTNTHLVNRADITLGNEDNPVNTSNGSYSYISGVGGGNGDTYVAYEDCENYGDIYYKGKHKCRVGGVVAAAWYSPDRSRCVADIRFYGTKGGSAKSDVGGVIGFYKAEKDGTIDGIMYKGYLNSYASSPRAYTGGLVGRVNDDVLTFTGCKLGGQVRGVGSSPYNTVAFVCNAVSSHEINVSDLVVETGTKRNTTAVTSLSLNHNSTGTVGVLCYGTTSETGTTTLETASTGTMTNCTIGSIE